MTSNGKKNVFLSMYFLGAIFAASNRSPGGVIFFSVFMVLELFIPKNYYENRDVSGLEWVFSALCAAFCAYMGIRYLATTDQILRPIVSFWFAINCMLGPYIMSLPTTLPNAEPEEDEYEEVEGLSESLITAQDIVLAVHVLSEMASEGHDEELLSAALGAIIVDEDTAVLSLLEEWGELPSTEIGSVMEASIVDDLHSMLDLD